MLFLLSIFIKVMHENCRILFCVFFLFFFEMWISFKTKWKSFDIDTVQTWCTHSLTCLCSQQNPADHLHHACIVDPQLITMNGSRANPWQQWGRLSKNILVNLWYLHSICFGNNHLECLCNWLVRKAKLEKVKTFRFVCHFLNP